MEINSLGMCEHCEIVSFDKDVLACAKKQRLNEIDEYWSAVDKRDKLEKMDKPDKPERTEDRNGVFTV